MVIIKKIEVPQDVYIIGDWVKDFVESFKITDDESAFVLKNGEKTIWMNTSGFVYILTTEELILNKSSFEEGFADNVVIKNFSGELILRMKDTDGNDILTEENYDREEYLMHQEWLNSSDEDDDEDDIEIDDIILDIIPSPFYQHTVEEVIIDDNYFIRLVAENRDNQIDEILKP